LQILSAAEKKAHDDPKQHLRLKRQLASRVRLHDWVLFVSTLTNTTAAIAIPWATIYMTKVIMQ
jgi:hypothetical protein